MRGWLRSLSVYLEPPVLVVLALGRLLHVQILFLQAIRLGFNPRPADGIDRSEFVLKPACHDHFPS